MAIKLIIGAGDTQQEGWTSLEQSQLDIRCRDDWARLFLPGTVDAVLSEHVLEHLFPDEAAITAANVFEFLAPGGYWRIAVPDANNPDPKYFEHNRPGGDYQCKSRVWASLGFWPDYPDHKLFYDIDSLSQLLETAGFEVRPLEWWTASGDFCCVPWCQRDGEIRRRDGGPYLLSEWLAVDCWNTSLIVDAVKR